MKRQFWLLDLNYEAKDGKPTIWLWGVTPENKRVLIIEDYKSYFYIQPKDSQDAAELKNRLENEKAFPWLESAAVEKKKLLEKELAVLRVSAKQADPLEKLARPTVKFLGAERSFEDDLRPATKYQNDYGIKPCQWYEVEGGLSNLEPAKYAVDETLIATSTPTKVHRDEIPDLRLLAFSILAVSQVGSPSADRDPVRVISWTPTTGKKGIPESGPASEKKTIQDFVNDIKAVNPDVIFSFGGNVFSWPYLVRRAGKNQAELSVGRDDGPPRQSLFGHFSITGRANVDLSDFAQDLYDVKDKSLDNVARFLGIKSAKNSSIDESEFHHYWSDPRRRKSLIKRIGQEAETVLELGKDALTYITQLSSLSGLPPDQVLAAAVGFRVDNYMIMEAHKVGQLIPSRNELPVIPYRGAIVLKPELGIHESVAVVDFSSMYPSLMIKYNISPDTYVEDGVAAETFTVPDVGAHFMKKPPGLYAIVLENLIRTRGEVKQEIARSQKGTPNHRILKARERATKIITNAVYGYAGWAGSRWYARQVAESAAAMGRDTIKRSIAIANRLGLKVLYGDTDSIFVHNEEKLVTEFLRTVKKELGLDISLAHTYKRVLFTEAMKKYAGLKENGELDVVGMEAIRGDWSLLAKNVQNRVLELVLADKNPSRALSYVSGLVKDLKSAELPLSSFVIWKTLTKRPDEYDVHAPHVEAAKKLVKEGWSVSAGDRVGFVIVKRPGKLFQKAEPYFNASVDDLDYDYYVQNQVLPVAARALSVFGITEEGIVDGRGVQGRLSAGSE